MTHEQQVTIYTAGDSAQASLLVSRLEENGIRALVLNETLQSGAAEIIGTPVAPKIVVAADDADAARAIAELFDRQLTAGAHQSMADEWAAEADTIAAWPLCPGCQQPRHTMCEICGTAGSDFPLADMPPLHDLPPASNGESSEDDQAPTDTEPALLVICSTCDEPFEPEFLRRCQWCSHDFGSGRDLDVAQDERALSVPIGYLNHRALALAGGMLAILIALAVYFATIASG